ncbi:unnamed protein product [Kuraishia capsulata CBS 1993]|uniref:Cytochrome c oxidase subunit 13, mitochondrial n=1 Tax=Kuraishia capsulata CBS 1993 TaxID=1382522 RepID=W6MWC7_9ASCO|nr:uncharacterized protein KUCA_T00003193001 [Kuraishia capsulata CBS 1993]CDK27215.1 unnamed protein product [Kuraishia capsulata CBS 1993]
MFTRKTVVQSRIALNTIGRRFASVGEQQAFKPANPEAAKAFKAHIEAETHHAQGTSSLWKKITYFVAFPGIALTAVNTYFVEAEHAHHREHTKHLSDDEWPLDYPYQNVRKVDFFWGDGDKTLFWNPDVNRHVRRE